MDYFAAAYNDGFEGNVKPLWCKVGKKLKERI